MNSNLAEVGKPYPMSAGPKRQSGLENRQATFIVGRSKDQVVRRLALPVTIRNPDKPFGTHVFTAMARNDAGLRWTAVTIDNGDDAKDALDRITIPQDVLDRIAPTALPRSSIIVSDEPLSRETNYLTEFVAVLNNHPQGGFLVRRPTVAVPVASGNHWGNDVFGSFFQGNWNSQAANTRPRTGQYYQPMQQRWW